MQRDTRGVWTFRGGLRCSVMLLCMSCSNSESTAGAGVDDRSDVAEPSTSATVANGELPDGVGQATATTSVTDALGDGGEASAGSSSEPSNVAGSDGDGGLGAGGFGNEPDDGRAGAAGMLAIGGSGGETGGAAGGSFNTGGGLAVGGFGGDTGGSGNADSGVGGGNGGSSAEGNAGASPQEDAGTEPDPYGLCDTSLGFENNPDCPFPGSTCGNGWCVPPCELGGPAQECPDPLSGNIQKECWFDGCNLGCAGEGLACPDGMECAVNACRWR